MHTYGIMTIDIKYTKQKKTFQRCNFKSSLKRFNRVSSLSTNYLYQNFQVV